MSRTEDLAEDGQSEHLKVLQRGVKAWNAWRAENVSIRPDLREADLSRADLMGANLDEAILSGANLSHAIRERTRLGRWSRPPTTLTI